LGRNEEGAVHLIEAALAAAMVMVVLFYVNSMACMPAEERVGGLEPLSSDLLNVLEFRVNALEHPALGFTLSSAAQWNDSSDELYADVLRMLPAGTYCYLETPYGCVGQRPAAGAGIYVRPFVASGYAGMLDCKLTLWRA
jgi:hypothetical protein